MQGALLLLVLLPSSSPSFVAAQPVRRLALVAELKVGQPDGPPEYALGRIEYMAVTATSSFFLFDVSDTQIRRYDAKGQFRGLVGRSGSGPGEYRNILGMELYRDSLLLVWDPGNGRITVFDSSGVYRREVGFNRGNFYGEKAFAVDRAGSIYVRASVGSGPREGAGIASQYIRLRIDGTRLDSIPLPVEGAQGNAFVLITADGARWNFPDRRVYALMPGGGLATASTSAYRITLSQGGTTRTIERAYTPIPITGAERAEWEAFANYFARRDGGTSPPATIPRVKPALRDLFFDAAGRLWVNVYTRAEKRVIPPRPKGDERPLLTIREVNAYELFDPGGTFLGRLELPPQSRLMAVAGDRIWVRTEAEGGDYILTRFRIAGLGSH